MNEEIVNTQNGDAPKEQSETIKSSGEENAPAIESKKEPAAELDPQKQSGIDKRITNLTRQLRTTQEQLAAEKSMRQELSRVNYANGQPTSSHDLPKPDRNQFPDPYDYAEALIKWQEESRVASTVKRQQQMSAQQLDNYKRKLNEQHALRADQLRKVMPDFDDAMKMLDGTLPESHILAIQKSPYSAEIAYQLAKNVDDATEFAMMDPYEAAMKVGELAVGMKNKPAGSSHKPMAPLTTANATVTSPDSKGSRISEIRKRLNKRAH
jgi:hypothetical protein